MSKVDHADLIGVAQTGLVKVGFSPSPDEEPYLPPSPNSRPATLRRGRILESSNASVARNKPRILVPVKPMVSMTETVQLCSVQFCPTPSRREAHSSF